MGRFWAAIVAYIGFDFLATFASAKWLRNDGRAWLALSALGYFACTGAWLVGIGGERTPGVARACAIYPVVAMLAGVVAAVIAGERPSIRVWIGVALGLVAVLLVALDEKAP